MKIVQILSERISLAKYAPELRELIHSSISSAFYVTMIWDDLLKNKNENELNNIFQQYPDNASYENLRSALEVSILKDVRAFLRRIGYPGVSIHFSKIDNANARGHAYSIKDRAFHDIEISKSYINLMLSLSKSIYKEIWESVPELVYDAINRKTQNNISKIRILTEPVYDKFVKKLTNTIIHELTHSAQHLAQDHNNKDEYEYRSLKQPDLYAFMNIPRNSKEYDHTWGWYRSSPQEIDAFAQGTASDILTAAGVNRLDEYEEIPYSLFKSTYDKIMSEIHKLKNGQDYAGFYKKGLVPNENYIDDKVRNKYYKKVIQSVNDYLEDIKKKVI
jgi:hypothetical protein